MQLEEESDISFNLIANKYNTAAETLGNAWILNSLAT